MPSLVADAKTHSLSGARGDTYEESIPVIIPQEGEGEPRTLHGFLVCQGQGPFNVRPLFRWGASRMKPACVVGPMTGPRASVSALPDTEGVQGAPSSASSVFGNTARLSSR